MKNIRWERVLLTTGLITIAILIAVTAYREWQAKTQGWCVRFAPDGSQKVLYGGDCTRSKH